MNQPTLSTLALCGSLVVALSALTASDDLDAPGAGTTLFSNTLPPEIAAAEANYETRQRIIEEDLHLWQLSQMDQPPEVRRELITHWMETNRQVLEEQAALSDAIDTLYVVHRVPPDPKPSELMASRAPTAEQESTPSGRLWRAQYEITLLREVHADDPEALRDAMHQWMEAHGQEMDDAFSAHRAESADFFQAEPDPSPDPQLGSQPAPKISAPASEDLRELSRLHSQWQVVMDRNPHPSAQYNREPTLEECEVWRDAVARGTENLSPQIDALSQKMAREAEQTLARENVYEHAN